MAHRRSYAGRTVVITGAAGGLGRSLSERFGRAGAKIGLLDINEDGLQTLEQELRDKGIECLARVCDIIDAEACERAIGECRQSLGGIDLLVNNAGLSHRSLFRETDLAVLRKIMEVNFFGAVHCTRAALESIVDRRGQIAVISTVAGFAPLVGRTGYSASKHALHGFFDTLRAELQGTGVDVLIVCPGFTATDMETNAMGGDGRPVTRAKATVGRVATPEEVAEEVYRAAAANRRLVVLTGTGKLARFVTRFWPSLFERLMIRSVQPEFEQKS